MLQSPRATAPVSPDGPARWTWFPCFSRQKPHRCHQRCVPVTGPFGQPTSGPIFFFLPGVFFHASWSNEGSGTSPGQAPTGGTEAGAQALCPRKQLWGRAVSYEPLPWVGVCTSGQDCRVPVSMGTACWGGGRGEVRCLPTRPPPAPGAPRRRGSRPASVLRWLRPGLKEEAAVRGKSICWSPRGQAASAEVQRKPGP